MVVEWGGEIKQWKCWVCIVHNRRSFAPRTAPSASSGQALRLRSGQATGGCPRMARSELRSEDSRGRLSPHGKVGALLRGQPPSTSSGQALRLRSGQAEDGCPRMARSELRSEDSRGRLSPHGWSFASHIGPNPGLSLCREKPVWRLIFWRITCIELGGSWLAFSSSALRAVSGRRNLASRGAEIFPGLTTTFTLKWSSTTTSRNRNWARKRAWWI